MSKSTRLGVLAASLLSLLGVLSSTAEAVTWHNSGATTFTGSGAAGTLSATGVLLTCTSAHVTGTVPALTVGATFTSSGTMSLTGCTLSGQPWTVDCSYTMTGTSQDAGLGSPVTGTTDVTCRSYLAGNNICFATGSISGSYFSTTPARATLNTGGNVIYRNGTAANCPLGNGDVAHVTARTQTSTSLNPPKITRTP